MPTLYPIQDTFVRGELSPRLHARASLDLYRAGLAKCENFITLPHGGIRKRGGTYFVGATKNSNTLTRLIPFIFSADQAYALEVGDLYLRVYAYGARVGTVEVVTPWPQAVLRELQFVQSADVMWIVHEDYPPRILTRTAHTSWSLAAVSFTDGPFAAVNSDDTHNLYASAATGAITITSDFPLFLATDVNRLIRIDMEDYSAITPWEPNQQLKPNTTVGNAIGEVRRYNGNVYICDYSQALNPSIRSGTVPPTHLHGSEFDGPDVFDTSYVDDLGGGTWIGARWAYLHSGFGVALITNWISATAVNATVISRFPDEVVGIANKSSSWRFGTFVLGNYADSVALFEERLVFGKRFSVYASKTGDFEHFQLGAAADSGLEFVQAGGGQANDIVWMAEGDGSLIIGTTGGIRALSGSGLDEALTPSSFKNRKSRTFGCAKAAPVEAGSAFLYITRSRKSIAELSQSNSGRFVSDDVGQISEHIAKKGVISLAFQSDPDPLLWFPLDNGQMGGFTYQPSQEVRGMHRHVFAPSQASAAVVESCIVTPGQTGQDDVWMIVKRTIGGVTKRYIEIMTAPFEDDIVHHAQAMDCHLGYGGGSTNTVTGLTHLAGETVDVLAFGKVFRGLVVSGGGAVSLPGGESRPGPWYVGLPFASAADSLELDVGGKDGSIIGRRKKVHKVILSLLETDTTGLEVSSYLKGRWETARLPSIVAPNGLPTLFTGNIEVPVEDSWEGQARIKIRHTNPTPCTIRAMTPVFDAEP